jgi:hypothetical protein
MIPGCAMPGKVFVGQRQEGFAVNLGTTTLVNAPVGVLLDRPAKTAINGRATPVQKTNVTSIAMEVHKLPRRI